MQERDHAEEENVKTEDQHNLQGHTACVRVRLTFADSGGILSCNHCTTATETEPRQ